MQSISHFLSLLQYHPAIRGIPRPRVLLGYEPHYRALVSEMLRQNAAHNKPFRLKSVGLANSDAADLREAIAEHCELFVLFYDAFSGQVPQPEGPHCIRSIRDVIREHWRKSVLFKDYGEHFDEAFAVDPRRIQSLNRDLIAVAHGAQTLTFNDDAGSNLTARLAGADQKWSNIDGRDNPDVVPGEIATHCDSINGTVHFRGVFLSTIPLAIKYGFINDPLTLHIINGRIESVACDNPSLASDFRKYLANNPSNAIVEELGIGTNEGVKTLYSINAGFEERHCGLHLGLGGGLPGSHHLDLIFDSGRLFFDEQCVFDGEFRLDQPSTNAARQSVSL